jgi:peptidoglycan hydrolase-like protein with peptidoglycan-binding domain
MRLILIALILLLAAPNAALHAQGGRRVALVVGIDGYANVQTLTRARNDANAIARQLTDIGFEVILRTDADRRGISTALAQFEERLRGAEVGMFFFAGHGVEIRGTNVLLPADIPATLSESILLREGFLLTDVAQAMTDSGVRYSALIIDACRDNPLPRQAGRSVGRTRGLGRVDAPQGTYVVYSAGIGEAALDRLSDADPSPNSVFTRYLLPALAQPGLSLDAAVKQVREQVRTDAASVRHQQNPAIYDQATGELFLIPQAPSPTPTPAPAQAAVPPPEGAAAAELVFWQSVQGTGRPAELEAYLERWPSGIFAPIARARLAALATPAVPRSVPTSAAPLSRDAIVQLQRRLAALGLDPGPADGAPGPRTFAAIRAAQYALGQTPDGEPSEALLARLGQQPVPEAPDLARGLAAQSPAALAERNPAEAVRVLEAAVRLAPRDGALWLMLGDVHRQRGANEPARRAYTTARGAGAAEAEARLAALPAAGVVPTASAAVPNPAVPMPAGRCGVTFAGTRTQDGLTGFNFRNSCATAMAFRANCPSAPTLARGDITIGPNTTTTVWAPSRGAAGACSVSARAR